MNTEHRKLYWECKHANPQWGEDIHFGIPESMEPLNATTFREAIARNTRVTCEDLLDVASVYWLSMGTRILDFGCGAGDLLLSLSEAISTGFVHGVDIAESAIQKCMARASGIVDPRACKFEVGGVEVLDRLAAESAGNHDRQYDIIIARDSYYMLTAAEQESWWAAVAQLLRPGGIVHIADAAVADCHLPHLREDLIKRQGGGAPISWMSGVGARLSYSIELQANKYGCILVEEPTVDEHAVLMSYAAASSFATDAVTRDAFINLSSIARYSDQSGRPTLVYFRASFAKASQAAIDSSSAPLCCGITLKRDFRYGPDASVVLRHGTHVIARGKWALLVGRSGAGKSTFLKLLSGMETVAQCQISGERPYSMYLMAQRPELVDELGVRENIALYAASDVDVSELLDNLGLVSHDIRIRTSVVGLSGGEMQRVALGQAIASRAEVILLDEPFAGVDRIRKRRLLDHLRRNILPDVTVVCIDHEFKEIGEYFDDVYEIASGQLVKVR